ncbi:MAG TPA: hypothetical protein VH877_17640 [Polyangia bacterium]|jgi:hypothetical protein|nr:hypothetical protein [Polyangia bacterium]
MRLPVAMVLGVMLLAPLTSVGQPVTLHDVPNTNGKWQEARGLVEAPRNAVQAWLTDYTSWPYIFSDVEWVQVMKHEGKVTVFMMRSRAFKRRLEIRIQSTPDGLVYEGKDGCIRTEGKIFLTSAGTRATDVTIQNVAHISGFLGAIVPKGAVRDRQRAKLRIDLTDLQRLARRRLLAGRTAEARANE